MTEENEKQEILTSLEEKFRKICQKSVLSKKSGTTLGHSVGTSEFNLLVNKVQSFPSSVLKLPLPKRFDIPEIKKIKEMVAGNLGVVIEALVESKISTSAIAHALYSNEDHYESIRAAGVSKVSLEALIMQSRFQIEKSPLFTLRDSLCKRLQDIEIGKDVPANFLRPPFNCCYIEIGEAENREKSTFKSYSNGKYKILEGAYCINNPVASIENLSQEAIETLELDKNKTARVIEVCFTGSSFSLNSDENNSALADDCDIISIFIQNENESINDILDRHIKLSNIKSKSMEQVIFGNNNAGDEFFITLKENLYHLIKSFLYIHSDRKIEVKETEYTDLMKKIKGNKNNKKTTKLKKQMQRAYDRIVVGPKTKYVPIEIALDEIKIKTGVRPHLRRGYLGVRWTGKGRVNAKITWVKPAIINSTEDESNLIRDYLVI
jgi:hypothetical protein